MKTLTCFLGLTFGCVFLLLPPTVSADQLWSGNVHAGGTIEHSITTPLETIAVQAGTALTISAEADDEWRLFDENNPFAWTNAEGITGIEHEGIRVGALVGRIGATGDWFFIGTDYNEEIAETGILYLACWDFPDMYSDNEDFIHVSIDSDDEFHPADFDHDNDIDGIDLAYLAGNTALMELSEFALAFGFLQAQDNADLVELTVSAGALTPTFSSDRTDYIVREKNSTAEIFITAVPDDTLASLMINDIEATSGVPFAVSLNPGNNFIRIDVTSQDGSVVKNYSIVAARDGIAALSDLTLAPYDLKPDFAPDKLAYNIDVEDGVMAVTITPETDDPLSSITVNDTPVPSGNSLPVTIIEGNNEIEVQVTGSDDSIKIYYVIVRKTGTASQTVFVVDQSEAPDEFETLTEAIDYLNNNLDLGQLGEVRIQTTAPMQVDALTITADMFFIVEPGASNVISGPPGLPLVINAQGGWNISGLSFTNSSGYTINSARGLSIVGSAFSADTVINVSGASGSEAGGYGDYAKGFEFERGILSGYLNINLTGTADYDFKVVGTNAVGITFDAFGDFVGDAGLILKSNPISDLNINASLKGNAKADIMGHGGVSFSKCGFKMEENASVHFKNNIIGTLEVEFNGLRGLVDFKNVTTVEADLDVNMEESTYTGSANTFTNWSFDVGYSSNLTFFGITERGSYAYKKVQINAEDAPTNAEIIIGFDNLDISGNLNLFAGGKAKVTLNNGTILKLDAFLKFPGSLADMQLHDVQGKAKFSVLLPDSNTQFFISAERSTFHKGMTIDTATDIVSGKLEAITIVQGGLSIGIPIGEIPGLDSRYIQSLSTDISPGPAPGDELIFDSLNIKSTDQPGLYIKNVSVPVTVRNSTIDAPLWSIVCADVDTDVTITDNSSLKGGIMIDGDPDMTGVMIDRQYTVSNNTITQNSAGGSCLHSHAIRNISVSNNTMTAPGAGSHGIALSGGKMLVSGGSINTAGPYICNAIDLGPSAGGANAVLYADSVNPITGGVVPSLQGYVKLTNNTFTNAIVFDMKNGRLLNDPVSDNSGLDPDEDVIGSLIDWNDDDHNCPDYPTDCDEWDEDLQECGCGEDGIDPPSEPGI